MSNNEKDDILPTFAGNQMPYNISFSNNEDDIVEETTRRVGGITTSFAPITTISSPSVTFGADIGTIVLKTTSTTDSTKPVETAKPIIEVSKISVTSDSPWKLKYAPFVPPFGHPLEPTAIFVPHTNVNTIAQRVSSILQERNIQATYRKSRAKCLTLDNVEFNIFLYQGKNEYIHGIIVEMQRWSGNSAAFYEDTRAILNGAKDEHHLATGKKTSSLVTSEMNSKFTNSLDFALKMLKGSKDSQFLGLQILSSMTDSSKMGTKTASAVSLKLTSSDSELLSEVFGIVTESYESSFVLQAMVLLSNIAIFQSLRTEDIKETLVSLIASDRPQVAYLAAKCFASHQIDSLVTDALKSAEKLGEERHHPGLYALSNNLLQKCI